MPRKPRIEFEGALYHVIARGNQRQRVFRNDADFQKYLDLLAHYKDRYDFLLYAYILMGNHPHLLVETKETPLSKILQGLHQSYTMYFNRRYRTVGHLFQGRYKAILCDRDAYLLALIKYIHDNPVRAKIAATPDAYRWSSHHAYTGRGGHSGPVDTDLVLRMFSENKTQARRRYQEFMGGAGELDRDEVYATIDQRLLGDETFVEQVMQQHGGTIKKERKKKEYSLVQIAQAVAALKGISAKELQSQSRVRQVARARIIFSHLSKDFGYRGTEIASYLNKEPAAITKYWRVKEEIQAEKDVVLRQLKIIS